VVWWFISVVGRLVMSGHGAYRPSMADTATRGVAAAESEEERAWTSRKEWGSSESSSSAPNRGEEGSGHVAKGEHVAARHGRHGDIQSNTWRAARW
jgi:hypothetical protein